MEIRRISVAILTFCLTIGGCVVSVGNSPHQAGGTQVTTLSGTLLGEEVDGIRIFKGIPYAAPPVGKLRWRPPQPPLEWKGVRDASQFGLPCPVFDVSKITQGKSMSGPGYDIFLNVPTARETSEDCLTLNIWTPAEIKRAAVMVWIQPSGPGSTPWWDGTAFARDGVVLVTINYRQLTLGNFAHPSLTREAGRNGPLGRFQTMDQVAALRWIKSNIAVFGGDPNNVTIFGESAGGASTLQIVATNSARGLFHKAIVQSGNGWWSPFSQTQMENLGIWLARAAGLPGKDATAEQLRALPPDKLPWFGAYSVDGRSVQENATEAYAAGRVADVPMMIGWNDFDGSLLRYSRQAVLDQTPSSVRAAYSTGGKSTDDLAYEIYTDSHDGAPARWIAAQTANGAPSYLYLFSYLRTANRGKVRGAAHADEIPFVFDSWDKAAPSIQLSDEDRAAVRMIHSCWVSFAKTGKPQCAGAPEWPRYSREDDRLMELGVMAEVRKNFRKAQLDAQEAMRQHIIDETAQSISELLDRLGSSH